MSAENSEHPLSDIDLDEFLDDQEAILDQENSINSRDQERAKMTQDLKENREKRAKEAQIQKAEEQEKEDKKCREDFSQIMLKKGKIYYAKKKLATRVGKEFKFVEFENMERDITEEKCPDDQIVIGIIVSKTTI